MAYSQVVTNQTQLDNAITAASPGTTITLANGTWNDIFIDINKNGTAAAPITITAQNAGAVLMTGNSRVYMEGSYLTVSGLVFQNPADLVVNSSNTRIEPVIELKTCDNCKIINNKIDNYNGTEAQKTLLFKWILADGQYNEIANNSFIGKYGLGSIINDNRNTSEPDYLNIHHNYFADRTPINEVNEDNDQDAIRMGNSSTSLDDSFSEVYDNYFFNFVGEVEVISNKSGQNKYYNNTFRNYSGTLTLRHGNNCEVYGNYFFAENSIFSGGLRVIGEGHKIYNNYIEGVNSIKPNGSTSDATGGINVSNGRTNSELNGYFQVIDAQIINNTFVNCDYGLRIGTTVNNDLTEEPENLIVANNIMYNTSVDAYQIETAPSGSSVSEGNMTNLSSSDMADDGDFHRLTSGSAPIDAGIGTYSFLTQDILIGNRDANFDAGAEEFGANGTKLPYNAADVGVNIGFVAALSPTSQTLTWIGDTGDWTDATKWDIGVVPTAGDEVIINTNTAVVSFSETTTVGRINISNSAQLTIEAGAVLTISSTTAERALESSPSGEIINDGTINISTTGIDGEGLYNKGTFVNNGSIVVDGTNSNGIRLASGTFTNSSTGTISVTNSGSDYINVDESSGIPSTFENNGTIDVILTTGDDGIYVNNSSIFNNAGTVNISLEAGASGGDEAIYTEDGGTFNNNMGGIITISSSGDHGISGKNTGTFNNNLGGTINIDAVTNDQVFLDDTAIFNNFGIINLTNATDVGLYVTDASIFTNKTTGEINITDAVNYSIQIDANLNSSPATIDNSGSITITGGKDGLRLQETGVFTNNASGILNIVSPNEDGINIQGTSGTVNNSGTIDISMAPKEGMDMSAGTLNNFAGALFKAADCLEDNLEINGTSVVNNDGNMILSRPNDDASGRDDIEVNTGATFNNTSNATFAPGNSPGELEIRGNFNLGNSTTTFEITGTLHTSEFDRIKSANSETTITITAAIALLDWGTYIPNVGDKFKIIDGSGTVSGPFATINSSNPQIQYVVDYTNSSEVEIEVTSLLPVELSYFEGEMENGGSLLGWETQSEENNDYFEVQYSAEGREFYTLDKVAGNGTTTEAQNYEYTHKDVRNNDNYYRLKQVDFDGNFEYSDIIYLKNDTRDMPIAIHPNPAHELVIYEGAAAILTFYDIQGKRVIQQTTVNERTTIDISNLRNGVYTIEIMTKTGEKTFEKLIKE